MEVDFAGKTFGLIERLTGEVMPIVVFVVVLVLPYSQYIYVEGMDSTKEMQWIEESNNALKAFRGVPAIVVCDNCKQTVIANKDWRQPELNQDYVECLGPAIKGNGAQVRGIAKLEGLFGMGRYLFYPESFYCGGECDRTH